MKTQTTFDDLVLEFPALDEKQGRELKGGGSDGGPGSVWSYTLHRYVDAGSVSGIMISNATVYGTPPSPYDVTNGSGPSTFWGGNGSSGGSNNDGGWTDTYHNLNDMASFAIGHVQAWQEFYVKGNLAFDGTLKTDLRSMMNAVVENPIKSFLDTTGLKGEGVFKGIAIADKFGKVLGIASAAESAYNLYQDAKDGRIDNWMNVADAVVSIGSLCLKSNIVGFAVSTGWLLVKGEFEKD